MVTSHVKLFFVGMNKTATTSIDNMFDHSCKMYRQTPEERRSKINGPEYKVYSDWGGSCLVDLDFLMQQIDNSLYILNTRPIRDWLLSSLVYNFPDTSIPRHEYESFASRRLEERVKLHRTILDSFATTPDKLIVLDVSQPNWETWLGDQLSLELQAKQLNCMVNSTNELYNTYTNIVDTLLTQTNQLANSLLYGDDHEANYTLALYKNNLPGL